MRSLALIAALHLPLLAACTEQTPEGTEAQLRASVSRDLRLADISDACIQSLTLQELTQVRAFANSLKSARVGTVLAIENRQRLRTFVRRYCPEG